jgi:hypothetical protein
MEKTLRLEWEKDPAGYWVKEGPDGAFLVPLSGRVERYSHDFDKTNLVFLELLNAVGTARRATILHRDGISLIDTFGSFTAEGDAVPDIVQFANKWGLPYVHHEARVEEFRGVASNTVCLLNLLAFERLSRTPHHDSQVVTWWVNRLRSVFGAAPTLPALGPERIESDIVYELPTTLADYCQHEFIRAFETLRVPLGKCHWCERLFARRTKLRKGEREFCPTPRGKCRHDFHNKGLSKAAGRTGVRPNLAA